MIDLANIDIDRTSNILIALGSAIATVIGFILKFRKNATVDDTPDSPPPKDFTATLLAERATLVKERDKALSTAATAWREREKLTSEVATLRVENEYLRKEIVATNRRIDQLMRAIHRLNPELLKTFGSEFTLP